MVKEDIFCGMVWNSETNSFTGIFTVRDILNLIKITYDRIIKLIDSGKTWMSSKNLFNMIFHHTESNLNDLDIIMENDLENNFRSQNFSNTSQDKPCSENNDSVLKNAKEFFKLFEYLTIENYRIDLHTVDSIYLG